MKYISSLNIKKFRGIKNLKLSDLGSINILVGENNAGKTSILEAIGVIENPSELGSFVKIGRKREILNNQSSPYSIFKNMFNRTSKTIEITAVISDRDFQLKIDGHEVDIINEESYTQEEKGFMGKVSVIYGDNNITENLLINQSDKDIVIMGTDLKTVSMEYITPIDHLLKNSPNEVIKKRKKKELIQLLNIFDESIIGLEMVEENKKTVPYIEHKKLGLMPLSTYGDGVKKVLLLGSSIIKSENGVLLIDEVETAIHKDALVDAFKWFINACKKYNVQVFMTTHSIEVIDSILESQKDLENTSFLRQSLRVITIKNSIDEKITKVRNLDGIRALEAREDFGLELR